MHRPEPPRRQPASPPFQVRSGRDIHGGGPDGESRALVGGLPWQQVAAPPEIKPEASSRLVVEEQPSPTRQHRRGGLLDEKVPLGPLDMIASIPWQQAVVRLLRSGPVWSVTLLVHVVLVLMLVLISARVIEHDKLSLTLVFAPLPGPVGQPAVRLPLATPDTADPEALDNELAISDKPVVDDPDASPQHDQLQLDAKDQVAPRRAKAIGTLLIGRQEGSRRRLLLAGGGSDQTERAVELALQWLVRQQTQRGTHAGLWSLRGPYADGGSEENRVAATAMALLALQGAGHVPNGRDAEKAKAVADAWRAILKTQIDSGKFAPSSDEHTSAAGSMYAHGQITMAICEAYGMTGEPRLRRAAQQALRYCLMAQLPDGGWRYHPPDTDSTGLRTSWKNQGDLSITGWFLLALKTAEMAGLREPGFEQAYTRVGAFIEQLRILPDPQSGTAGSPRKSTPAVTMSPEEASDVLGYDYQYNPYAPFRRKFQSAISAEAVLGKLFLGASPDDPHIVAVVGRLLTDSPISFPPLPNKRQAIDFVDMPKRSPTHYDQNVYAWYYITQVCHHMGGQPWRDWNVEMRVQLPRYQQQRGAERGSWSPVLDLFGVKGGRLFSTALSACMLETYYRHLSLHDRTVEHAE